MALSLVKRDPETMTNQELLVLVKDEPATTNMEMILARRLQAAILANQRLERELDYLKDGLVRLVDHHKPEPPEDGWKIPKGVHAR